MRNKRKKRNLTTEVLTANSPFIFSEAYKSLRTNVDFMMSSKKSKVILVTSSIPHEGKTSVSINLAVSLAQTGKKVLLVDCDIRKPKVHAYLRIKHSSQLGLSSVLSGECMADEAIGYVENLNLYVMLAGAGKEEATALFDSEKSANMIKELSERFDYVICDTAPVSIVTDAAIISRYSDGVLFVIRHNYTNRHQTKDALAILKAVEANVIGCVLNRYDLSTDLTYSYNKYYHYHEYSTDDDFESQQSIQ